MDKATKYETFGARAMHHDRGGVSKEFTRELFQFSPEERFKQAVEQRKELEKLGLTLAPQIPIQEREYGLIVPNSHGCTPVAYETLPCSPWVKMECHCGNLFWTSKAVSAATSCARWGGACKTVKRSTARLQLTGMKIGSLEVTGHESGRGWKLECDCGRTKYTLQGTAIKNGSYKTCGQCSEQERQLGREERQKKEQQRLGGGGNAGAGSDLDGRCEAGHPPVAFESLESGECPMCEAIETMGELRARIAELAATVVKLKTRIDRLKAAEGKGN